MASSAGTAGRRGRGGVWAAAAAVRAGVVEKVEEEKSGWVKTGEYPGGE
jgi:hypothetical protein